MPLFTFVCPDADEGCETTEEVLCSFAEAQDSIDNYGERQLAFCHAHSMCLRWQGVELPQRPDMNGTRGGNFKVRAVLDNNSKIPLEGGRSSRTPKRKR